MNREARIAERVAASVTAGMFEPPPRMVEAITAWVVGVLAYRARIELYERLENYEEHDWTGFDVKDYKNMPKFVTMGEIDELEKVGPDGLIVQIRRGIKRMDGHVSASPIPPKLVNKTWKKAFKLDLSGWKYASKVRDASPERLRRAKAIYPSVLAEINMRGGDDARAAWYRNQRRLVIFLDPMLDERKLMYGSASIVRDLKRTIAHELRHFCQDYLHIIVGSSDRAGLPSKRIRTPDVEQNMARTKRDSLPQRVRETVDRLESQGITPDIFHDLDDAEFYTELAGAIETIQDNIPHLDSEVREQAILSFMDAGTMVPGAPPIKFMKSLKKHARGKWQKAVKEIVKAVL